MMLQTKRERSSNGGIAIKESIADGHHFDTHWHFRGLKYRDHKVTLFGLHSEVHRRKFCSWWKLGNEHVDVIDIRVFSLMDANVLTPDAVGTHVLVDPDCGSGESNGGVVNEGL
jgi:hypothetical protein